MNDLIWALLLITSCLCLAMQLRATDHHEKTGWFIATCILTAAQFWVVLR